MNIFQQVLDKEHDTDRRLGMPLSGIARERRLNAMAVMNPKGFRTPAKDPAKDSQGRTRGQRKRALRSAAVARAAEQIAASRAARIAA
jgi:hypothetical protein